MKFLCELSFTLTTTNEAVCTSFIAYSIMAMPTSS